MESLQKLLIEEYLNIAKMRESKNQKQNEK